MSDYKELLKKEVSEIPPFIGLTGNALYEFCEKVCSQALESLKRELEEAKGNAEAYLEGSAEWEDEARIAKRDLKEAEAKLKLACDALEFVSSYPESDKYFNQSGALNMKIKCTSTLTKLREGGKK